MIATPSQAVMARVRERVGRYISTPVSDADALSLCISCATVESDALLELSHDRIVYSEATTNASKLALLPEEFDTLLCDATMTGPRRKALALALRDLEEEDDECKRWHSAIEAALPLTMTEAAQRQRWQESARVRMRVSLAMLRREDHIECLESALGGVLQSDHRLVEDLRAATEEEGIDIISVASAIGAVSRALSS